MNAVIRESRSAGVRSSVARTWARSTPLSSRSGSRGGSVEGSAACLMPDSLASTCDSPGLAREERLDLPLRRGVRASRGEAAQDGLAEAPQTPPYLGPLVGGGIV